ANARFLFYGVLVLALLIGMKPWFRAVVVLLGTIAFGFAVHAIVGAVWSRGVVMIPPLYLAAFVWENKLVEQVSGATRLILLGALLVVIMNVRPSGIFGTARVEIV